MIKQRGSALVLVIFMIMLFSIGFGGYYWFKSRTQVSPSPTPVPAPSQVNQIPASTWKTDSGQRYSFKYPPTWLNSTDDPSKYDTFFESGIILISSNLQLSNSNPQTVQKGAFISTSGQSDINQTNNSFENNLAEYDSSNGRAVNKLNILKEERMVLDGQPARKRIYKLGDEGYVEVVFEYPKNAGYMWFDLASSFDEFEQNQKDFDQILSTFKFTN